MQPRTLVLALVLAGSAGIFVSSSPPPPPVAQFFTLLSGAEEVPPVATRGRGAAIAIQKPFRDSLSYVLVTTGLTDIVQAHIHTGAAGTNGPVVAFLFDGRSAPVTRNGLLAMGEITASDLRGPLTGQPLSALLDEMESGNTYVNVHTLANPAGEIRGQLQPSGP